MVIVPKLKKINWFVIITVECVESHWEIRMKNLYNQIRLSGAETWVFQRVNAHSWPGVWRRHLAWGCDILVLSLM